MSMVVALLIASSLLHPCGDGSPWYCAHIVRPLDATGSVTASISVHFEWLPHRSAKAPSRGVIVANAGGPGSGSTQSRDSYRDLFGSLLATHDLLLVDNRGTGSSGAIDCEPLQSEPVMTYASIGLCGDQLGDSVALYGTGLAADDLAAILDALAVKSVDLYGESYGTFFVQAFAARHPGRVRSMILDGAFPVQGDSPWYESEPAAMRRSYNTVCKRASACMRLPGTSIDRIARLLDILRAKHDARVEPAALATVMAASGLSPVSYRELDAAARAYIAGDALPLVRLVRESYAVNELAGSAVSYSRGLFMAVSCADYPQAYDMQLSTKARRLAWTAALNKMRNGSPDLFSPFTIDEWMAMAPDFSTVKLCLRWPALGKDPYPPGQPVAPDADFPDVPVLVISGELDTITTIDEGAAAAALFSQATQVIQSNGTHVNALDDPYGCASRIARRFVETHATGDITCLTQIPEVRMVPTFARTLVEMAPATPAAHNRSGPFQLRAAAVAVQTVGDALARTSWMHGNGTGLRGGSYRVSRSGNKERIALDQYRWAEDLAVSGAVTADHANGAITAQVTLVGVSLGALTIEWNKDHPHATASVAGNLDGQHVVASCPAP